MAHFAKLDNNNIVEQVIVVSNDIATTEQAGVDFINQLYKTNDVWKQTSYNNNIRKNYAGIGYTYDENRDAFISPKPFDSWILNEQTCNWEAPIAYPVTNTQNRFDESGNPINDSYTWNEENKNWDLVIF